MLRSEWIRAVLGGCAAALALVAAMPAGAQQAASAPGSGFADPKGLALRPPTPDIDPVYRGPSIDMLATVRKRGLLRIGVAVNEPMVMHGANGELVGYSIDLGKRLASDLGVQLELVETSWSSIVPDLLERHFDLIASGLWMTLPRALVLNYTNPTAIEGIHLVASKPLAGKLGSSAEFNQANVKIVVYAGTEQERLALRMFPKATLVKVDGDADHLAPVIAGAAHAALVPSFAPQLLLRVAPEKLFLPLERPLTTSMTALGVRKGDPDFVAFLNTWLELRRADGWLAERGAHWADPAAWPK